MSEQDLVRACLQYLEMKPWLHWRNNTGGMSGEHKGKKWFMRFGATGSPDIFILKDGKLIGIECKAGKNKQSDAQKEWENKMKQNGGEYYVIYNVEELLFKL